MPARKELAQNLLSMLDGCNKVEYELGVWEEAMCAIRATLLISVFIAVCDCVDADPIVIRDTKGREIAVNLVRVSETDVRFKRVGSEEVFEIPLSSLTPGSVGKIKTAQAKAKEQRRINRQEALADKRRSTPFLPHV